MLNAEIIYSAGTEPGAARTRCFPLDNVERVNDIYVLLKECLLVCCPNDTSHLSEAAVAAAWCVDGKRRMGDEYVSVDEQGIVAFVIMITEGNDETRT